MVPLGDTGQRIVVGAKNEKGCTESTIMERMEAAIENRSAGLGIFT